MVAGGLGFLFAFLELAATAHPIFYAHHGRPPELLLPHAPQRNGLGLLAGLDQREHHCLTFGLGAETDIGRLGSDVPDELLALALAAELALVDGAPFIR